MIFLLLFITFLAVYSILRFYLLKNALRETTNQLQSIQKDMTKNQFLHLSLPDHDLEELMKSINSALRAMHDERIKYEKREKEFQLQIEAISHDLRTPLTVILGYLAFLQKQRSTLTVEQQDIVDIIERKSRSMEKLISQFYDYSRITAGGYKLDTEKIDAGRILREVFAQNCLLLEKARLNVQAKLPKHPLWISAEQRALERIFSNLFQNAARYAQTCLKISISENDAEVRIIFENDTEKIQEKDVPYIFDRFYMADPSRSKNGTGLGLTIARRLAEEMQGSLSAQLIDSENCNIPLLRFTLCLKKIH